MFHIPTFLLLAVSIVASAADASPDSGVFYAQNGSKIVISDVSDTIFKFTLLVGAEENALECIEGFVDCISIEGEAKFDGYYYQYFDPSDLGSSILFDMRGEDIKIIGTNGILGTGTANHNLVGFIPGRYELKESDLDQPISTDDLLFFRSPTGNINCLIATGDDAEARCDMQQLTPSFTRPPPGCDLEWGSSFAIGLSDRKGQLACVGDTVIDPNAVELGYGETLSLGGITCMSEKSGLTCTNPAGHGFTIAKATQTLF